MFHPDILKRAMVAGALVTELAVLTAGGVALGFWLDGRFGTEPWLTLLFCAGGFASGLVVLMRGLNRNARNDEDGPPPDA